LKTQSNNELNSGLKYNEMDILLYIFMDVKLAW